MDITDLSIRKITEDDEPYIYNSFLRTAQSCKSLQKMQSKAFYGLYHDVIKRMLAKDSMQAFVACDPSDEWFILAYGFVELTDDGTKVVHYMHVRGTHRNMGVFDSLMKLIGIDEETTFFYTFDTRDAVRLNKNKYLGAIFRHDLALTV